MKPTGLPIGPPINEAKAMRLMIVLFMALALLSLPAFEYQARAQGRPKKTALIEGPRLSFGQTVFEAGETAAEATVGHDFVFENTGTKELKILKVTTSCGCTAADFDRVVAPGQKGRIKLQIKLYDDWAGRQLTQSALVESNDPAAKYTPLVIKATVLPKS